MYIYIYIYIYIPWPFWLKRGAPLPLIASLPLPAMARRVTASSWEPSCPHDVVCTFANRMGKAYRSARRDLWRLGSSDDFPELFALAARTLQMCGDLLAPRGSSLEHARRDVRELIESLVAIADSHGEPRPLATGIGSDCASASTSPSEAVPSCLADPVFLHDAWANAVRDVSEPAASLDAPCHAAPRVAELVRKFSGSGAKKSELSAAVQADDLSQNSTDYATAPTSSTAIARPPGKSTLEDKDTAPISSTSIARPACGEGPAFAGRSPPAHTASSEPTLLMFVGLPAQLVSTAAALGALPWVAPGSTATTTTTSSTGSQTDDFLVVRADSLSERLATGEWLTCINNCQSDDTGEVLFEPGDKLRLLDVDKEGDAQVMFRGRVQWIFESHLNNFVIEHPLTDDESESVGD
jgi:hypothetical protein